MDEKLLEPRNKMERTTSRSAKLRGKSFGMLAEDHEALLDYSNNFFWNGVANKGNNCFTREHKNELKKKRVVDIELEHCLSVERKL